MIKSFRNLFQKHSRSTKASGIAASERAFGNDPETTAENISSA